MMKIFGNVENGNYIEVQMAVGIMTRTRIKNTAKSLITVENGLPSFKEVTIDKDPDIILLLECIKRVVENGKDISLKGNKMEALDTCVNNVANFEEAIEFIKMKNNLREYGTVRHENIDKIESRIRIVKENLEYLEKVKAEKEAKSKEAKEIIEKAEETLEKLDEIVGEKGN